MPEDSQDQLLTRYVRAQKILFLAEQCLNLTKKSLSPLLRRFGLNHSQYLILMILRYARMNGERVIGSELSYLLGREKHSITPLVDSLFRKGFVHRQRGTEDRRAVYLDLTDAGEQLIAELQPKTFETVGSIPVGTEDEFERIYSFLESFRVRAARNSHQDPDLYRNAYDRLLVKGEAQLSRKFRENKRKNEEPASEREVGAR